MVWSGRYRAVADDRILSNGSLTILFGINCSILIVVSNKPSLS